MTRRYPRAEPGAAGERRRLATWSLGSAALAASLAVMATLGWVGSVKRLRSDGTRRGRDAPARGRGRAAADAHRGEKLNRSRRFRRRSGTIAQLQWQKRSAHARGPLVCDAAARIRWLDDRRRRSCRASHCDDRRRCSDSQDGPELWKELNPNETTTPTPVWPWGRPLSGDSI